MVPVGNIRVINNVTVFVAEPAVSLKKVIEHGVFNTKVLVDRRRRYSSKCCQCHTKRQKKCDD
jgi:hypothetical protein